MKRQRNTAQMKEHTRNTEVQINEEKTGKLPEKELRTVMVKMIKNPENNIDKRQESINKDLEELKNKHTNNTITEIKNTLEGINSRISEAEERISELELKMVEITSEQQNKVKGMLVHLMWSQRSLRLSSALFIPFTLLYFSEVIATILPSSSLIHSSASDILLLIPSRVFFNFSNCFVSLFVYSLILLDLC